MFKRSIITAFALAATFVHAAEPPIKIGEIASYKMDAVYLTPYKKGMELAVEEINAAGGVLGRKIELVIRDDNGNPGDAIRAAEELRTREKIDFLIGSDFSNIAVALGNWAKSKKMLFIAGEPQTDALTWSAGNDYTFRLRPSVWMQTAALVQQAAPMKKKRWALVYPNFEWGTSAVAAFKKQLLAQQPDAEFVADIPVPFYDIDAPSVVQKLIDSKADAVFVQQVASDLQKFVREGNQRGVFGKMQVFGMMAGEPEYLDTLKTETPKGWIVTGYAWQSVKTPEHQAFEAAWKKKYGEGLKSGAMVGYSLVKLSADMLKKTGSTDTAAMLKTMQNFNTETPLGRVTFRAIDHQSTMGLFVGKLDVVNGEGVMKDSVYIDGSKLLPSDEVVKTLRAK